MAKTISKSIFGLKKTPTLKLSNEGLNGRIKEKAYELWEQKGRIQGKDFDIWLEAEKIVKGNRA